MRVDRHPVRAGRFATLGPFYPAGFAPREVKLWIPPEAEGDESPRPALLVFDGQDAFSDPGASGGGWGLHEALERMDPARYVRPIVAAIPQERARRADELLPWPTEGFGGGRGDAFLNFALGQVAPALRARFPLLPGPVGISLLGASWGGALALYGHFSRPEYVGGAVCLSPALWVGDFRIFPSIERLPKPQFSRIYLDSGALEAEGRMLTQAGAMAHHLAGRGFDRSQLAFRADASGQHEERFWRRRLPRALRFFFAR